MAPSVSEGDSGEAREGRQPAGNLPAQAGRAHPNFVAAVLGLVRGSMVRAGVDCCAWVVAFAVAGATRSDLFARPFPWTGFIALVPIAILAQVAAGSLFGVYRGRWRYGSFDEFPSLVASTGCATGVLALVDWLAIRPREIPLGSTVTSGIVALVIMAGVRYGWRHSQDRRTRAHRESDIRMLVFGAGGAGIQAVTAMLSDDGCGMVPVALLDDDPAKRNLRILGIPVLGDRASLARAAAQTGADTLLIAVPTASRELVEELDELAQDAHLSVKILPPVSQIYGGLIALSDIHDISEEDLIGRRVVTTDVASIAGYLRARTVLVTGAGGSIGSELCRQVDRFGPAALYLLDFDASGLHSTQLSINGESMLDSEHAVLADIRDARAIGRIFDTIRPDVVFHCAAVKHLSILERYPDAAFTTNVLGTLNVLRAAVSCGVERFVNISTDKAADPVSILGYSKRIGERMVATLAGNGPGTYMSVRFGNVLGSRGSVLPTFHAQVDAGGPITVTDPKVTRYFMTIAEAVELVIQAGAIAQSGETLVLDMGEPVRIVDIARRLASRAAHPVKIVFTGLRPGEKLHEALMSGGETDRRPMHPLISHVTVEPYASLDVFDTTDPTDVDVDVVRALIEALGAAETSEPLA